MREMLSCYPLRRVWQVVAIVCFAAPMASHAENAISNHAGWNLYFPSVSLRESIERVIGKYIGVTIGKKVGHEAVDDMGAMKKFDDNEKNIRLYQIEQALNRHPDILAKMTPSLRGPIARPVELPDKSAIRGGIDKSSLADRKFSEQESWAAARAAAAKALRERREQQK